MRAFSVQAVREYEEREKKIRELEKEVYIYMYSIVYKSCPFRQR